MVEFTEAQAIHTIFIALPAKSNTNQKKFGVTHVRIGDDSDAYNTVNTLVKSGMTSGGFHELDSITSGKYLTIGRDAWNGNNKTYWIQ